MPNEIQVRLASQSSMAVRLRSERVRILQHAINHIVVVKK